MGVYVIPRWGRVGLRVPLSTQSEMGATATRAGHADPLRGLTPSRSIRGINVNRESLEAFDCRLRETAKRLAKTRAMNARSAYLMKTAPELERTFMHRLRFVWARRKKVRALLKVVQHLDREEVIILLGVDPETDATETQSEIVRAIRLARCTTE